MHDKSALQMCVHFVILQQSPRADQQCHKECAKQLPSLVLPHLDEHNNENNTRLIEIAICCYLVGPHWEREASKPNAGVRVPLGRESSLRATKSL